METVQHLLVQLFSINSIWSVVFRGILWLVVSIIIIASLDNPNTDQSLKNMKANLGFFFMFVVLGTILISLLFGFQPMSA